MTRLISMCRATAMDLQIVPKGEIQLDGFEGLIRSLPANARCGAAAIEPVIGHMKAEGHLGHCYLKRTAGDAPTPSSRPSATTSDLLWPGLRILLGLVQPRYGALSQCRPTLNSVS
jgi:hypothetical protein